MLTGARTSDFRISPTEAGLLIAAERPALVYVCSPNNPTGKALDPALIEGAITAIRGLSRRRLGRSSSCSPGASLLGRPD